MFKFFKNKSVILFLCTALVNSLLLNTITYAHNLDDLLKKIDGAEMQRHYIDTKTVNNIPSLIQTRDENEIGTNYMSGPSSTFVKMNGNDLQPSLLFLSKQVKGQRPFAFYFSNEFINSYNQHPASDYQNYAYANNVQQKYELKGNPTGYYMQTYLQKILDGNYPSTLIGISENIIDEIQPIYSFRTPSGYHNSSVSGTLYNSVYIKENLQGNVYKSSKDINISFNGDLKDGYNTNTIGFTNTARYKKNHGNFIKTTAQGMFVGLNGVTPSTIVCNANINGGYSRCTYRVSSVSSNGNVSAGAFFPDDVGGRKEPSKYYNSGGTPIQIIDCEPGTSNCSNGGLTRASAPKKYIETNPSILDEIYHHGCVVSNGFWQGMAQNYADEWIVERENGWYVTYHKVKDKHGNYKPANKTDLQTTERKISEDKKTIKDYNKNQLLATYESKGYPIIEYPKLTNSDDYNYIYDGKKAYIQCDGEQLKGYILTLMKELKKDSGMLTEAGLTGDEPTWQAYKDFIEYWSKYINVGTNAVFTTSSANIVKSNGYYATFTDPSFYVNNDMAITKMSVYLGDDSGNKEGEALLELKRNFESVFGANSYSAITDKSKVSFMNMAQDTKNVSNISPLYLKSASNSKTTENNLRSVFIDEIDYKDVSKYTVNLKPYIEKAQQEIIDKVTADYETPPKPTPEIPQGGDANVSSLIFPYDICLNEKEETLTEETAKDDRKLEDLIDEALINTKINLVFEVEHSFLSPLDMGTVLTDSCIEKTSSSRGNGDEIITCNENSSNKITSVIVGMSDITDYKEINSIGDSVMSRGFFTHNKYSTSKANTNIKDNAEGFTSRSIKSGNKVIETFTLNLTGEEITKLMNKKAFSVRSHINRGHTIAGDDTNLTNNYAFMIFSTDSIDRPESIPCSLDGIGCTGVAEDGIYLVDAETNQPVTPTEGGLMEAEVIPGRKYRLVVEGTYIGGKMIQKRKGYYSSCTSDGSCGCCSVGCTSPCKTSYTTSGNQFLEDTYKDYSMSWSGKIIGAKFSNTPSISEIISNMKFNTSDVLIQELSSVSLVSIIDTGMSDKTITSGNEIKFTANADTDQPIRHKYVSKEFIAEAQRIEISLQEGSLWTEEAITNYSGGGCGSYCKEWSNSDILTEEEIGFGNGTSKNHEKIVFSNPKNNWNLKITNFEPLPKAEFALQDKEINIAVKYDLLYEVPEYAKNKYETDIYVAFKATSINDERYKIEKIHIVPGLNKNITQYMSFPVSKDMENTAIEVSVLVNIPAVTTINAGGIDNNGDYIPPTYAPSTDNTRAFEYNYCDYECPIRNKNKILSDNSASGEIYIVSSPEFCSIKGITCGNEKHWSQRNDWTTPYILRNFTKNNVEFKNLLNENRKLINYFSASSEQNINESHYENLNITGVKFRSKMTEDLKYGSNGWVDIFNGFNKQAVIKAGYGFELEIDVMYETNALNKNDIYINSDNKSVNQINIAPNLWDDIQLMLPDGTKVSMQGHMEGNKNLMDLKAEPDIKISGGVLTAKWTYTIKNLGSPDDIKEYNKFKISENTKNGRYKIIIATPVTMGIGNKQSFWWYDGGDLLGLGVFKSNRLSPPSLAANLLCDKVEVEFSVMGSIMDDPNTHTGN